MKWKRFDFRNREYILDSLSLWVRSNFPDQLKFSPAQMDIYSLLKPVLK